MPYMKVVIDTMIEQGESEMTNIVLVGGPPERRNSAKPLCGCLLRDAAVAVEDGPGNGSDASTITPSVSP